MTAQVSEGGVEIAGTLKRLPSLPNAEHQRLFNAENCTVSTEGRVFITGSTAVYEILPAQGHADPYEYREITIIADEVPKDCFRNGITTFGDHLYLACAHIRQWEKSAFPDWRPALNAISQTRPLNLTWLWLAEVFERVDSYVVRADLRKDPVRFDECLKIWDNCFANGLAADQHGNLYLAPISADWIRDVSAPSPAGANGICPAARPPGRPSTAIYPRPLRQGPPLPVSNS